MRYALALLSLAALGATGCDTSNPAVTTSDWAEYSTPRGVVVYPVDWHVSENTSVGSEGEESVSFEAADADYPNPIEYRVRPISIEQWIAELAETEIADRQIVTVGTVTWTRVIIVERGREDVFYLAEGPDYTFGFASNRGSAEFPNANLPVLEEMITRFRPGDFR